MTIYPRSIIAVAGLFFADVACALVVAVVVR